MKKSNYMKAFAIICMLTIANLAGFSQTITYPIVGTGQTISYDTAHAITMPASGQAFCGRNSNHSGKYTFLYQQW